MDSTLKILLFASDPIDGRKLNIAAEVRGIEAAVNDSPWREFIQLKVVWNAAPEDLLNEICRYHPQIVHYCGRGTKRGLIMHGNQKKSKFLEMKKLLTVLHQVREEVELLFLNSCFSSSRAKDLAGEINRVVCIEGYADDKAAVLFPGFFYRYLGYGYSAEKSVELAKAELIIRNINNEYKPVFISNEPEEIISNSEDEGALSFIENRKLMPQNFDIVKKLKTEFINTLN